MQVMQVIMDIFETRWREKTETTQSRLSTFIDLAFELVAPFRDPRAPERPPLTEQELFYALAGETPETLRDGTLLTARVVRVMDDHAFLRTDSGA
jgi:transcriptional accessory protein Tex/SPT6